MSRRFMQYAAYGSNLHPVRLQSRTPSAELLGTGVLNGWQLGFHKRGQDGSGKCNIRPGAGRVFAAVYRMHVADIDVLDAVEGVNRGYQRISAHVGGFDACWVYRAEEAYVDPEVRPFCWYRRLVIEGCRFHAFPHPYVAQISEVRHEHDPDEQRLARHAALLRRMADCNRTPDGEK